MPDDFRMKPSRMAPEKKKKKNAGEKKDHSSTNKEVTGEDTVHVHKPIHEAGFKKHALRHPKRPSNLP